MVWKVGHVPDDVRPGVPMRAVLCGIPLQRVKSQTECPRSAMYPFDSTPEARVALRGGPYAANGPTRRLKHPANSVLAEGVNGLVVFRAVVRYSIGKAGEFLLDEEVQGPVRVGVGLLKTPTPSSRRRAPRRPPGTHEGRERSEIRDFGPFGESVDIWLITRGSHILGDISS